MTVLRVKNLKEGFMSNTASFPWLKKRVCWKSGGSNVLLYPNTVLGRYLLKKQGEARCYRDLGFSSYSEDPSVT